MNSSLKYNLKAAVWIAFIVATSCNRNDFSKKSSIEYTSKQMLLSYLNQKKALKSKQTNLSIL